MQNTRKRLIIWAGLIAAILLIPLILTIRDGAIEGIGWNWTLSDFIFMGVLLFGSAVVYEFVAKRMANITYRAAVGLAVLTTVLLVWINAAVGIIGDGDLDSPNAIYFAMLAIGFIFAAIARFETRKMSYAMFAMAAAQMLVPVIALVIGTTDFAPGVLQVFGLNAVFAVLWIGSALLFRYADISLQSSTDGV